MALRILIVALATSAFPLTAMAQSRVYVGGTLDLATQTESDNPLGGTTLGGRALIGVQVSPSVSIEFEPSFNGSYSWEYRYPPSPSLIADVVARRRNTFLSGQARIRYGFLEPVIGVSYIRGNISRHATIGSTTYFDDSGTDNALAVVGGLDAAIPLSSHFSLVPTTRVLARLTGGPQANPLVNPLESQTTTGAFLVRYGAGLRATF